MELNAEWKPVVLTGDCRPCHSCGEPVCPRCRIHYADCLCPGPSQDDLFHYREIDGCLMATPSQ